MPLQHQYTTEVPSNTRALGKSDSLSLQAAFPGGHGVNGALLADNGDPTSPLRLHFASTCNEAASVYSPVAASPDMGGVIQGRTITPDFGGIGAPMDFNGAGGAAAPEDVNVPPAMGSDVPTGGGGLPSSPWTPNVASATSANNPTTIPAIPTHPHSELVGSEDVKPLSPGASSARWAATDGGGLPIYTMASAPIAV